MLQSVAECCRVVQCIAGCVAGCCRVLQYERIIGIVVCLRACAYVCMCVCVFCVYTCMGAMGWLRLVGSLKS